MRGSTDDILRQLTLEEAAALTSGSTFWRTEPVERLGVPAIMLTDGPHGLRKQAGSTDHLGVAAAVPATCFPPAVGLGSTWNPDLLHEVGQALGAEAAAEGVSVLLGPGANIKRSPLCGRNFEYLSEDPLLSGDLAAALIAGIQSRGVGASLKHYAVNNQEHDRMRVDAQVDERTLREVYLAGFERAVRTAAPWTVMCAYNKVNGTYASEHRYLLTSILRDEWGFDGVVVSDWGAVNDRVAALEAGTDLEMPSTHGVTDRQVVAAVEEGRLARAVVDTAAARVLGLVERTAGAAAGGPRVDHAAHHALARRAAREAAVLLKNDGGLLPIDPAGHGRLAVIGTFAAQPRYQGAGSSQVNPTRLDDALTELRALAGPDLEIGYAAGFAPEGPAGGAAGSQLVDEAFALADGADVALLFLGLPGSDESEGYDRRDLGLPADQVRLLEAVATVNPRIVVVLANGGVVATSAWDPLAPAILEGWLGGQAGGGAIADLLLGVANPSGRLAETVPIALEHTTAYGNFPGELSTVRYGEGLHVGYRGYDARLTPVAYPFGHGLSYTTFGYGELTARVIDPAASRVELSIQVTNTGQRWGQEVVQVYVGDPAASLGRPVRELKAHRKVALAPGEWTVVTVELDRRAFAYYHPGVGGWVVESGAFEVSVGASSRDLRATAVVDLPGEPLRTRLTEWSTLEEVLAHPVAAELLAREVDGGGVGLAVHLLGETSTITPEGMLRQIAGLPMTKLVDLFPTMPFGRDRLAELILEANAG